MRRPRGGYTRSLTRLYQIYDSVRRRTEEIAASNPDRPCRKGCDECCRNLASVPQVTRAEWDSIAAALDGLTPEIAAAARDRIRDSASATRPVVCPLLDTGSGACLIYDARPVACRAYGFYAERESVLGCRRIEAIGRERPAIVWGNHEGVEERLRPLGPAAGLAEWLGGP